MRIPPSGTRPIQQSDSTSKSSGTVAKKPFGESLSPNKSVESASAARAADIIADVKALADEVKQNGLSKEEATKRFASIVLEKRHDLSELGNKAEQVKEAIKNIAGDDPNFVARLNTQLEKLSKA